MRCASTTFVFLGLALAPHAHGQTVLRSVAGPLAGAQFGKACITIPDQNGDGFEDVLVGAPGFNSGRGTVYCISGAYLAGGGAQTLWIVSVVGSPGDNFGYALADAGDVNGDGLHDFLVGQPGFDNGAAEPDAGAVRLVYGGSLVVASIIRGSGANCRFGKAMTRCGDLNFNGVDDFAISEPGWNNASGSVSLFDGAVLGQTGNVPLLDYAQVTGTLPGAALGESVASGYDLTGDGHAELVVGWPGFDNGSATDAGRVLVRDFVGNTTWTRTSTIPGERLGSSVSIGHDYDGDGVRDIVAGAPGWSAGAVADGRVRVLSGAKFLAPGEPAGLYMHDLRLGLSSAAFDFHFGASVYASADLNGDGVGDIIAGAPSYTVLSGFNVYNRGAVAVFSGATGARMALLSGSNTDRLGDAPSLVLDDYDSDGFPEFLVAGSLADANGVDSGVIKSVRLFPATPTAYCTTKVNSQGCSPAMSWSGAPSASSSAPFTLSCSNVLNQVSGLYFYSHAPNAAPFQDGTLCVKPPTRRTPISNSGGAAGVPGCSGVFHYDFNARIQSGVDPTLVAGAQIFVQCWSRDPASASLTSLSNAARFLIAP